MKLSKHSYIYYLYKYVASLVNISRPQTGLLRIINYIDTNLENICSFFNMSLRLTILHRYLQNHRL
jgi:hypothetical protein